MHTQTKGERLLSMGVLLLELHDEKRILTDRLDNEEPEKDEVKNINW
jgi:hypothetical protein